MMNANLDRINKFFEAYGKRDMENMCVLWKFREGKIIEGQHLVSDQKEADYYFQNAI